VAVCTAELCLWSFVQADLLQAAGSLCYSKLHYVTICCYLFVLFWSWNVLDSSNDLQGHSRWMVFVLRCLSFFFYLLRADVQPTSGPQHWDRVMIQCASPGRGRELVGVCGCVHESGEGGVIRRWTACWVFLVCPL